MAEAQGSEGASPCTTGKQLTISDIGLVTSLALNHSVKKTKQCNFQVNEGDASGVGTGPADTKQWPVLDRPQRDLSANCLQCPKAIHVRLCYQNGFSRSMSCILQGILCRVPMATDVCPSHGGFHMALPK